MEQIKYLDEALTNRLISVFCLEVGNKNFGGKNIVDFSSPLIGVGGLYSRKTLYLTILKKNRRKNLSLFWVLSIDK